LQNVKKDAQKIRNDKREILLSFTDNQARKHPNLVVESVKKLI